MLVTCSWWGLGARTIWDNQPQRHDGGFVDAIARRATGLRGGVAGVDAEFVVEDGPVDASGSKEVPVGLDDEGELVPVTGFKGGGNGDYGVEFGLVEGRVPEDAVVAGDGEVKGCGGLAQEGAVAIAGKDVEVFVDVLVVGFGSVVAAGGFWSPDLWGDVDQEGARGMMSEVGGKRAWGLGGKADEDGLAAGELSCKEGLKGGRTGRNREEMGDGGRGWRGWRSWRSWRCGCLGAGLLAGQTGRALIQGAAVGVGRRGW
eukprot:scaffold7139_cov100-Amphora_coffeaeformis.AAC.10